MAAQTAMAAAKATTHGPPCASSKIHTLLLAAPAVDQPAQQRLTQVAGEEAAGLVHARRDQQAAEVAAVEARTRTLSRGRIAVEHEDPDLLVLDHGVDLDTLDAAVLERLLTDLILELGIGRLRQRDHVGQNHTALVVCAGAAVAGVGGGRSPRRRPRQIRRDPDRHRWLLRCVTTRASLSSARPCARGIERVLIGSIGEARPAHLEFPP
mmetsp:Transcript_21400/g.49308  ORF Transcript_21400/g.49308 Transcript_21400/m.49308 type:complete len:210 (+) Transcript_21400:37-666(+)